MAETDGEYVKRLRRIPGIFGDGDAVTAIFGPQPPLAEDGEEEEPVSTQEEEVEEEQEEPESVEEEEVEEEEQEEEVEEVKEEPESHRAEDVIKAINLVNTVEEVDSLAEDDERRTVIKAANKRREDLTQEGDDE